MADGKVQGGSLLNVFKRVRVHSLANAILDSMSLLIECRRLEAHQNRLRLQLEASQEKMTKCLKNLMASAVIVTQKEEVLLEDMLQCVNCNKDFDAVDVMEYCMHVRTCCFVNDEIDVD